jgi:hypothetical protein
VVLTSLDVLHYFLCFANDGVGLPEPQKPIPKHRGRNELPTSYLISTMMMIMTVTATAALILLLLLFFLLIIGRNTVAGWRLFPVIRLGFGF